MSSEHSPFAQRFAVALQKLNRNGSNAYASEVNDTDRLITLLEAATETFDVNDPQAVEGVFAIQGCDLHRLHPAKMGHLRKHACRTPRSGAVPRNVQDAQRFQESASARCANKKFERTDC